MTKLNHDEPYRESDPGRVIEVSGPTRPWSPPAALRQTQVEIQQDRERRKRHEAELKRWENTTPQQIARIVGALIAALQSAPTPGATETMKDFRLRTNAWQTQRKRAVSLAGGDPSD